LVSAKGALIGMVVVNSRTMPFKASQAQKK
jgi:hypothetical protein